MCHESIDNLINILIPLGQTTLTAIIPFNRQELQKGNPKAFRVIFDALYDALYCYALNFVSEAEMAEELVQEAFLMIWDRRKMIDADFNVKAYLYKSIHNQALNYIRHLKVVSQHANETTYLNSSAHQKEKEPNPFLTQALEEAIAALPERSRLIFRMSRMEDMRHREISEKLSISEKTVEVQIRKARIFLQKKLKRYYNEL